MNFASFKNFVICLAVVILFNSCPSSSGQSNGSPAGASALPPKITPVRVVRDFELGSDLEQITTLSNVLLERREMPVPNVAWQVSSRLTAVPTAIFLTEALNGSDRRVGVRIDYLGADGVAQTGSGTFIDYIELEQLEAVLNTVGRGLNQANPGRDEVISYHYVTKGGFKVTLSVRQGTGGPAITATVGGVSERTKEGAARMFDGCRVMVHETAAYLATR